MVYMTIESLNDEALSDELLDQKYAYQPLNNTTSIRVLRLELDKAEPLTFSIEQCDLNSEEAPEYIAVSYTWSGSIGERRTRCDSKDLMVPSKVHSVLSRLRTACIASYRGDPGNEHPLIWLDAICINQTKTTEGYKERAIQVPLMSRIYPQAAIVIVDLGETESTEEEVAADDLLFEYLRHEPPGSFSWEKLVKWLPGCVSSEEEASCLAREALKLLLHRPWFTRVWVVQEYALAPPGYDRTLLMLGDSTITSDHFAINMSSIGAAITRPGAGKGHFDEEDVQGAKNFLIMRQIRYGCPRPAFSSILKLVCRFDATDPRDKIYGCLGLNDSAKSNFKVDYFEKLEYLCRRIVLFLLDEEETVEILYQAQTLDHELGWTSWSWDPFRTPQITNADDRHMHGQSESMFDACKGTRVGLVHCEDDELSMEGQEVDEIAILADPLSWTVSDSVTIRSLWSHCTLMMSIRGLSIADPTNCEALWRTLIRDEIMSACFFGGKLSDSTILSTPTQHFGSVFGCRAQPWDVLFCWAFHEASHLMKQYPSQTIPVWLQQMSDDYVDSACNGVRDRRVCITTKGRLGLVPIIAEVGDKIVVLNGGRMPFVMRKGPQSYRLVGEGYIHGIMDGEAIGDDIPQRINIR